MARSSWESDWIKDSWIEVLSVTGDEDFQYTHLGQAVAEGDFFDGISQLPAETKGH